MKKNQLLLTLPLLAATTTTLEAQEKPNIVFILADDMGYGDVSALNPDGKIPTPNIDRMVESGVAFADAHTTSSVSTPSRYGVLTGRYNWRSTLKSGVLGGYSEPIIPTDRTTVAAMLKRANYTTGCVGKWHLGWDWPFSGEGMINLYSLSDIARERVDYTKPIENGPTDLGFDYFYGFSASLDIPPYIYIENDMPTTTDISITENKDKYGWWREGTTGADFDHNKTLEHVTGKGIEFMKNNKSKRNPFFLYLPLPAPHTPILPSDEWLGKSGINHYADFVMMVDSQVGRVLDALKEMGIDKNTLVVFTADNGCSPAAYMDELEAKGHSANYIFRGTKADLFEGGHRVPCVVRWPDGMKDHSFTNQTISLADFYATFAEIANVKIEDNEGEDSHSVLKALIDPTCSDPIHEVTIHHSINGSFAIRSGEWKLLVSASSGGWSEPTPNRKELLSGLPPMQLYNLKDDISETTNLYNENPEKAEELLKMLQKAITEGRTTPGKAQSNEMQSYWRQLEEIF